MAYVVPLGIPHGEFLDWDENDQAKALAFKRLERETCICGTRAEEWEEDRFAYIADMRQCPGCELLAQEEKNVPEGAKGVKTFLRRPSDDEGLDDGAS